MKLKFMPHQQQILDKTEQYDRVAYYLDMGLGKTFVGAEKMWQLNSPVNLLICQKSKVDDWVDHLTEYYEADFKMIYDCTKWDKKDWKAFAKNPDEPCVMIINYELAFRRSYIAHMTNFTLMLDESSLISNENAKRSKFVLKLKPENVILLSGTPTAGKYERLWSQCQLLGWEITKKAFYSSYIVTEWIDTGMFKQEVVTGYKNVDHLKKQLHKHGAVFMKTEEVIELPEKIEQKISIPNTPEYKKFIKKSYLLFDKRNMCESDGVIESDWNSTADTSAWIELVGDNTLTKMLYARQLCGQWSKLKLQAVRDLVESTEDRMIIFYNFDEELRQMENHLAELNRPYSYLNGKKKDLTAYNCHGDSITFIQYQAGAMGGNFQKANKIIYFTLPLGKGSCDLWEQSKKRVHRIGQTEPCFYYYLLVKGSIEEKNLRSLQVGKDYTDELFKKSS